MTDYHATTWSDGEAITTEKLNAMTANDQYLFERVVDTKYVDEGSFAKTEGIRIFAKADRFPMSGGTRAIVPVRWDGFFSPGCKPVVNVTVGRRDRNRMWVSVKGPGEENWPNSLGCEIHGIMDPDANYKFAVYMPIHIIAIGY